MPILPLNAALIVKKNEPVTLSEYLANMRFNFFLKDKQQNKDKFNT